MNWQPAGPGDGKYQSPTNLALADLASVRSPCPLLNTLANHGYLPHDGKNITEEQATNALKSGINLSEDYAKALFQAALTTNPDPHGTTFSLDELSRHNILEHDASLRFVNPVTRKANEYRILMIWRSRQDYYFGDDHSFNQAIFDQTRSHWKGPFIDIKQAAAARQARVDTSNATNPTFTLTQASLPLTFGESAAYFVVLGNKTSGIANRAWVEYFFGEFFAVSANYGCSLQGLPLTFVYGLENERFPVELGWAKPEDEITASDQSSIAQRIADATERSTEDKSNAGRWGDHHGGHAARRHAH